MDSDKFFTYDMTIVAFGGSLSDCLEGELLLYFSITVNG